MAESNIQLNDRQLRIVDAYYTGSIRLQAGQPLCYQPIAGTVTGLGFDVDLPDGNNFTLFAGIVAPSSVGVSTPGRIQMIVPQPGDIIPVLVSNTSAIALGSPVRLNHDIHTATAVAGTLRGAFDLIAPATVTAAANVIFGQAVSFAGIALETLAVSTGSGDWGRTLLKVQFK